jgi:hypothetical protein
MTRRRRFVTLTHGPFESHGRFALLLVRSFTAPKDGSFDLC